MTAKNINVTKAEKSMLMPYTTNQQKNYYNASLILQEIHNSNEPSIYFWDLYQKAGINTYIEQMTKLNEFGKYHYSNIQANYDTCIKLDKFVTNNLVNTKNRYSRMYTEKVLKNMAAMDSLQWSPKMQDDLPDDVIRIILPGNKKYVEVTKEMLSYGQ
jgi:hypothetical protein